MHLFLTRRAKMLSSLFGGAVSWAVAASVPVRAATRVSASRETIVIWCRNEFPRRRFMREKLDNMNESIGANQVLQYVARHIVDTDFIYECSLISEFST